LLGGGDGTFRGGLTTPAGGGPVSLGAADLDGDGRADLIEILRGTTTDGVGVLRGNGDGTFQAVEVTTAPAGPLGVAIGDLNGDGRLDVATAHPDQGYLSVFLGAGGGALSAGVIAGDVTPRLVTSVDLNGDGALDLVLSDLSSSAILVALGNGDGTFRRMQASAVAGRAGQVLAGDLNGDGRVDLVVASVSSAELSVLLGKGDGTFQ